MFQRRELLIYLVGAGWCWCFLLHNKIGKKITPQERRTVQNRGHVSTCLRHGTLIVRFPSRSPHWPPNKNVSSVSLSS